MNEQIKRTYIETNNLENEYNEMLKMYILNGFEIEDMTIGSFQVEHTLEWNEAILRGMLLESDLCKQLEEQGVEYTFSDLKSYIKEYGLEHDTSLLDKLAQQYEMNDQLGQLEKRYVEKMAFNLQSVIGNNLMSKYNEKGKPSLCKLYSIGFPFLILIKALIFLLSVLLRLLCLQRFRP